MDPPLTAGHPMMDVRVSTSRSRERRHYDNRRGDHRRRGGAVVAAEVEAAAIGAPMSTMTSTATATSTAPGRAYVSGGMMHMAVWPTRQS